MTNVSRKLEVFTNLAVLFAAFIVGAVAIKQYVLMSENGSPHGIKVGAKVNLRDVDWSQRPKNLVLAISDGCHFCSESASFYQRLLRHTQNRNDMRVMAVLPQPVTQGTAYLRKLDVPIADVRQVAFNTIPIGGTPTILLVDSRGVVERTWLGKLTPEGESEVLKEAGCNQSCN